MRLALAHCARFLAVVAALLLAVACVREEDPHAEHPAYASACRQLDQADALATWIRLDTVPRLRETRGYDEGAAAFWQADVAVALGFEMFAEAVALVRAAGDGEIADRMSDAGVAVLDLGQTVDQLAYMPNEEKLEAVRSAVAAVDRAVKAAYRTFNEKIAPCAALRPEGV